MTRRSLRTNSINLLLLLLPLAGGCNLSVPTRFTTAPPPGAPTVSVMTYNVNFGVGGDAETMNAIARPNVDIVLLQEVNAVWERALRARFTAAYPFQAYHGNDGYAAGFAILSRFPIESIEQLPKVDWFPATRAIVRSPLGRLQLLNVHLRPPISNGGSVISGYYSTRGTREREIREYAGKLQKDLPTVVAGDFNENESGRAVRWLRSNGFHSALPQFAPRANTWRWPVGFFTLRARYDHVFYSDVLYPLDAAVRNTGRSDHLPVTSTFALRAAMTTDQ